MKKQVTYYPIKFSPEVIKEALSKLCGFRKEAVEMRRGTYVVNFEEIEWNFDTQEEFFSNYRKDSSFVHFYETFGASACSMQVFMFRNCRTIISVEAKSMPEIESVFEVFEGAKEVSKVEPPKISPTIFIGHGHSNQWRDLKDHLQDKQGYKIEAYEVGARAGHAVRDILQDMLDKSSFAILVMTGEDESIDGTMRARQNVVHEAGLFQGKLGFNKAIVLVEEGTDTFSNIEGIHQIRFKKGNIKETFGDVIATLKRECL